VGTASRQSCSRQCQVVSDTAGGITKKYFRPYDGPWKVARVKNPTSYEVANEQAKYGSF